MADLAIVEGPYLQQVLDHSYPVWHDGLSRASYGRYYAAQLATPWGRTHLQRLALVERGEVLASAKLYTLDAMLDGRPLRIAGIGAAVHRTRRTAAAAHARAVVEQSSLERSAEEGATVALLFSIIGADYYAGLGIRADRDAGSLAAGDRGHEARGTDDARPRRRGSRFAGRRRHGDAPAPSATGSTSSAIATSCTLRLSGNACWRASVRRAMREVQFFVAEEGSSAVAYVVITVRGGGWVLEECGDRDPTGARVGAILQVLIARDPSAARPAITAWLPSDFRPPQIKIVGERPSSDIMMMRGLGRSVPKFSDPADGLYWHSDMF